MSKEEIEQGFVNAGWELDGSFSEHLVIGEVDYLSILAHRQWTWETDDPMFELWDTDRDLTYWVRVIPMPRQAAVLLEGHGAPSKEESYTSHEPDQYYPTF